MAATSNWSSSRDSYTHPKTKWTRRGLLHNAASPGGPPAKRISPLSCADTLATSVSKRRITNRSISVTRAAGGSCLGQTHLADDQLKRFVHPSSPIATHLTPKRRNLHDYTFCYWTRIQWLQKLRLRKGGGYFPACGSDSFCLYQRSLRLRQRIRRLQKAQCQGQHAALNHERLVELSLAHRRLWLIVTRLCRSGYGSASRSIGAHEFHKETVAGHLG